MTTKTINRPLKSDPPGWRGNVYYCDGKGYGVAMVPGKNYDYDIIYPLVPESNPEEPPETPEVSVQKIEQAEETPEVDVINRGRPNLTLSAKQLTYLNKDLSIREKAKAMGVSKSTVANLLKKVK